MAKSRYNIDSAKIERWIDEGRGQGELTDYKPWLRVYDVPSKGLSGRIPGSKTGRVHHLLSLLEIRYFFVFEWMKKVIDIREQFPLLPFEETVAIAQSCGIRHPFDNKTKHSRVMTTDFLLTFNVDNRISYSAVSIKYSKDLNNRTLEKFEIEREYWHQRQIDLQFFTERELPFALAENIRFLHPHIALDKLPVCKNQLEEIIPELTRRTLIGSEQRFRDIAARIDADFNLKRGTALNIAKHLIVTRQWWMNLDQPLRFSSPLLLLGTQFSSQLGC